MTQLPITEPGIYAAAFGVSPATISAINVGRLWSHV